MGVVFKITVSSNDVESKETDTLRIKWIEKGKIESYDDFRDMEYYPSRLFIEVLIEVQIECQISSHSHYLRKS